MRKIKRFVFLCMSVLFVCMSIRIVNFFIFRPVNARITNIDTTDIEQVQIVTYQYKIYGFDLTESIMKINTEGKIGDTIRVRVNPMNPPEIFDSLKLKLQTVGFLCLFVGIVLPFDY